MDLLLVPTYNRPEFLHLCLERILSAPGSDTKDLWIAEDRHLSDRFHVDTAVQRETAEVVARVKAQRNVRHIQRIPHNHFNNSFNVLEGYKEALVHGYEYVYLIEDDVMVLPDFFFLNGTTALKKNLCLCRAPAITINHLMLLTCWI